MTIQTRVPPPCVVGRLIRLFLKICLGFLGSHHFLGGVLRGVVGEGRGGELTEGLGGGGALERWDEKVERW